MKTITNSLIVTLMGVYLIGCSSVTTKEVNYSSECKKSDVAFVKGYFHNLKIGDTPKEVFSKLRIKDPFPDVVKNDFTLTVNLGKNQNEKLILYFNKKAKLDIAIIGKGLRIKHKRILEGIFPSHVISYYPTGEKMFEVRGIKAQYHHVKSWTKDGKVTGDGSWKNGKKFEGTFWLYEYQPVVIATYSYGKLISTCDKNGNPVDVSKLPKKTKEELARFNRQIKTTELWVK